jgi:hypothetical protein
MKATSHFPGGNGVILSIDEHEGAQLVRFIAEPRNSAESLYWRIKFSTSPGKAVLLRWCQTQNCLGMGKAEDARPVWRNGHGEWQRAASVQIIPEGLGASALQFSLTTTSGSGEAAFIYPYEEEHLAAALKANPHWTRHVIGVSGQGRVLEALSLGAFPAKRGIFLTARQHCNENSGAWTLDGFIRAAEEQPNFGIIAIPSVDPDGAVLGDYGKDKFPQDFNRAWGNSTAMRPETLAIRRLMQRWHRAEARPLAIDLHSPGGAESTGPYFFSGRMTHAHSVLLNRFFDDFYATLPQTLRGSREELVRLGDYPTRWPKQFSFADNTSTELHWPATSMEIPYQGIGQHYFDIDDYRAVGRTLYQVALRTVVAATDNH